MKNRILVSGASGLIGRKLIALFCQQGHAVSQLLRPGSTGSPFTTSIVWDPQQSLVDRSQLEGHDVVIHLGGETLMGLRWSAAKKLRIRNSRVQSTDFLARQLAQLKRPPRLFLVASAVGYYGSRGDEKLVEASTSGSGFLSQVCQAWEAAAALAMSKTTAVIPMRFGVVLSPDGGLLRQMLPAYRLGLGGRLGNGKQYLSWIAIDDVLGAITHVISHPPQELLAPLNFTAPKPVTNVEFNHALAKQLHRPAFFHLPTALLKFIFGQLAEEMMLASTRALPESLERGGYHFQFPELQAALKHLL
jgi:uncharacterized protein (TIGR01777 family)